MTDVKKNVIVNHSVGQMFKLVDRIEDYPLFLPWCGGTKVLERNTEITKASIHIKYSGVNQSFTTQNTKHYPDRSTLPMSFAISSLCRSSFRVRIASGRMWVEAAPIGVIWHPIR